MADGVQLRVPERTERPLSAHSQQGQPAPAAANMFPVNQWMACGITQIVFGGLCVIFNSIEIACAITFEAPPSSTRPLDRWISDFGCEAFTVIFHSLETTSIKFALSSPVDVAGFWCGAFVLVAGVLGIATTKSKIRYPVVGYLIICIISILSFHALYVNSIAGAHLAVRGKECLDEGSIYLFPEQYRDKIDENLKKLGAVAAMEALLVICAIVGSTMDIWGIILGSKVIIQILLYGPPPTPEKVHQQKVLTIAEERYMLTKGKQIADRRSNEQQKEQLTAPEKVHQQKALTIAEERYMLTKGKQIADRQSNEQEKEKLAEA